MKELIEEIILNSEKSSTVFIADSEVIGSVALDLLEDGILFVEVGFEEVEELMETNDILAIAKNIYNDGTVDYFIERVFNKNGETLQDDSDIVFIDSDLIDCIDRSKFSGAVISVELRFEDTDDDEELFEELTSEVIQNIIDNQDKDEFCLHCTIKDALAEAYEIGFRDGSEE